VVAGSHHLVVRRRLVLLSLLLAACGGGDPPSVTLRRPALKRTTPPPAADRVVAARTDHAGWTSDAPVQEVIEEGGLRLRGGARAEVSLPGTYTPGDFDLVRVEVLCGRHMTLRVGLRGADGPVGSLDVGHARAGTVRTYEFDLRQLTRTEGTFEELLVLGNRTSEGDEQLDWTLLGVTTARRAPARWLPVAGEDDALIDIAGDSRRGVGLVPGHALALHLDVPTSGGQLRYAVAPAPRVTEAAAVSVSVAGDARPHSLGEAWSTALVDLDAHAGERVEVRFEATGAPVALEQPTFLARDDAASTTTLVTSDTHRAAYLGEARAGVDVATPHLDALAARGVLFEDCFASSNNTLPSHAALMTGRDPAETGVTSNQLRLADSAETLAERFAAAGYVTYAVTSAKHMHDAWSGLGQGFDRLQYPTTSSREQPATDAVDVALAWLDEADGAPVLLWLHVFDVHRPYEPPEADVRRYYGDGDPRDQALPVPAWPTQGRLRGVRDRAWIEALYRGQVTALDRDLARLLEAPRVERGVVALTSDHGESLGEQGIFWDHQGVYPAVLRVPLVLAWPGAPGGTRVSAPVRQLDVARTLLALAGIDDAGLGGVDLASTWSGGAGADLPRFALGSEGHAASVTSGRWQLVVNLDMPKAEAFTRDLPAEEPVALFDLAADPYARTDVAAREAETVARLGAALLRWLEAAPAAHCEQNRVSGEGAAMLAALGYATSEGGAGAVIDLAAVRTRLAPWLDD